MKNDKSVANRVLRRCLSIFLLASLYACATVPINLEKSPDYAWSEPGATALGQIFARETPGEDELSGVYLLDDPRAALHSRLELASLAEHTLDLQYYLWKGDTTGSLLLHRALAAADRGVRVRILIDDIFHSGRDAEYAAIDAHPNVSVRVFNPVGNRRVGRNLNFLVNKRKLNSRMHNKIFLVDGAVAVLGGRNIGDDYFGIDPSLSFRDLDVLAVGKAARDAGEAYDLYWNGDAAVPITALRTEPADRSDLDSLRSRLETALSNADAIPFTASLSAETAQAQLATLRERLIWAETEIVVDPLDRFSGASESAFIELGRMMVDLIERDIVIQTAYLIPSQKGVEAMAQLVARGVRIRILTNSLMSNNHVSVHAHYMKYRKRMLEAGVELYEYRADAALLDFLRNERASVASSHSGLHTKAAIIDQRITLIGSYNMDPRSRNLNSEIGLLIMSEEFARVVLEAMERDFDPTNSYNVRLDDRGRLRWHGTSPSGPVVHNKEPDSTFRRRLAARLIRLIPVEDDL